MFVCSKIIGTKVTVGDWMTFFLRHIVFQETICLVVILAGAMNVALTAVGVIGAVLFDFRIKYALLAY